MPILRATCFTTRTRVIYEGAQLVREVTLRHFHNTSTSLIQLAMVLRITQHAKCRAWCCLRSIKETGGN